MNYLIFDLETNGLLADVDKIHSLVIKNVNTQQVISCADQDGYTSIDEGVELLMNADALIGHNIIKYDLPVLRKLYSHFDTSKNCIILDTLVMSRLWAPELDSLDYSRWLHIEPKYKGRHSLAAWGERLCVKKIKFKEWKKLAKGLKTGDDLPLDTYEAFEQHFDKILIESNKYKEGPIIALSEEFLWRNIEKGTPVLIRK